MAVSRPVRSQPVERRSGQRYVAVFGPFTAMDVNHHPLRIDVTDLQVTCLFEPEPHAVGGPEIQGDPFNAAGIDDRVDLLDGQDFRERLGRLQLHRGERFPGPFTRPGVKELDAGEGDANATVGELLFVLEVQEVSSEFSLGDPVGSFLAVVGQLPDGAEVSVYGPLAHASELQVITHSLIELAVKAGRIGGWVIVVDHGEVLVEGGKKQQGKMPAPERPASQRPAKILPPNTPPRSGLLEPWHERGAADRAFSNGASTAAARLCQTFAYRNR